MSDLGISSSMSSASSTPSGMTGAGGGNRLRITGLNTGLDVDSIVKKMLKGEQTKIDEVKSQEQILSWKQDEYNAIIKEVRDLQSSYFDVANLSNDVMSPSNYSPFTVNYTGTSGSVTATAYTGAKTGNYTVSFESDGHLASAATITGGSINTSNTINSTHWSTSTKIGFSINGSTTPCSITLSNLSTTNTNYTASDVATEINNEINLPDSQLKGKVQAVATSDGTIQFRALGQDIIGITSSTSSDLNNIVGKVINPSGTNTLGDLGFTGSDTISITCDGTNKSLTVNSTDTIDGFVQNLNNATDGMVTAKFSQLTGNFTISSSSTGSSQSLNVAESGSGNFLSSINMTGMAGTPGAPTGETTVNGQDAIAYITPPGGSAVKVIQSNNNFIIDGISYSLNSVSDSSFTVGTDTTKVHDMITSFIAKYNTVVGDIQDQLNEEKDYKYQPLTDAQKSSMSQTDITNWETKAKQGILRNDTNLQNILNNLESAFTSPVVDSSNNNLTSVYFGTYGSGAIGIDSSLTSQDEGGGTAGKTSSNNVLIFKIGITNDQKFTDAISQHPDQVLKLFTNTSTETDLTKNFNESGIFERINNILTDNVGMVRCDSNSAILTKYANNQDSYSQFGNVGDNTLPDQLYNQEVQLKKLDTEYNDLEDKYYNQFTQLEVAEERISSESSILTGLSGSSS